MAEEPLIDLPLVQEGPSELMSFEDYKMSQPVSGLGPESDESYRERYKKYVDFYNNLSSRNANSGYFKFIRWTWRSVKTVVSAIHGHQTAIPEQLF